MLPNPLMLLCASGAVGLMAACWWWWRRKRFHHSRYCPEFDKYGNLNHTAGALTSEERDVLVPTCTEWIARLDEDGRQKCWRYLNTSSVFAYMHSMMGSNWILYMAAVSHRFGFVRPIDPNYVPAYDCIHLDDPDWCRLYFEEQRARLLNDPINRLSSRDLDRCWCLFYATGDLAFADRVKEISNMIIGTTMSLEQVSMVYAADWSYRSHLNGGRLVSRPDARVAAILNNVAV